MKSSVAVPSSSSSSSVKKTSDWTSRTSITVDLKDKDSAILRDLQRLPPEIRQPLSNFEQAIRNLRQDRASLIGEITANAPKLDALSKTITTQLQDESVKELNEVQDNLLPQSYQVFTGVETIAHTLYNAEHHRYLLQASRDITTEEGVEAWLALEGGSNWSQGGSNIEEGQTDARTLDRRMLQIHNKMNHNLSQIHSLQKIQEQFDNERKEREKIINKMKEIIGEDDSQSQTEKAAEGQLSDDVPISVQRLEKLLSNVVLKVDSVSSTLMAVSEQIERLPVKKVVDDDDGEELRIARLPAGTRHTLSSSSHEDSPVIRGKTTIGTSALTPASGSRSTGKRGTYSLRKALESDSDGDSDSDNHPTAGSSTMRQKLLLAENETELAEGKEALSVLEKEKQERNVIKSVWKSLSHEILKQSKPHSLLSFKVYEHSPHKMSIKDASPMRVRPSSPIISPTKKKSAMSANTAAMITPSKPVAATTVDGFSMDEWDKTKSPIQSSIGKIDKLEYKKIVRTPPPSSLTPPPPPPLMKVPSFTVPATGDAASAKAPSEETKSSSGKSKASAAALVAANPFGGKPAAPPVPPPAPVAATTKTVDFTDEEYLGMCKELYSQHDPKKVAEIPKLTAKYGAKGLYGKICEKFKLTPKTGKTVSVPATTTPTTTSTTDASGGRGRSGALGESSPSTTKILPTAGTAGTTTIGFGTTNTTTGTGINFLGTTPTPTPATNSLLSSPKISKPLTVSEIESKIREIYSKHSADKLNEIPNLMKKYSGKELEFLQKVEKKYLGAIVTTAGGATGTPAGATATPTAGPDPAGTAAIGFGQGFGQGFGNTGAAGGAGANSLFGKPKTPTTTPTAGATPFSGGLAANAPSLTQGFGSGLGTGGGLGGGNSLFTPNKTTQPAVAASAAGISPFANAVPANAPTLTQGFGGGFGQPAAQQPAQQGFGGGFGTGFGNAASSSSSSFANKVLEIYQKHNPAKIGEIPELLQKYAGKELELMAKLEKKYGGAGVGGATGAPSGGHVGFGGAPTGSLFGGGSGAAVAGSSGFGQGFGQGFGGNPSAAQTMTTPVKSTLFSSPQAGGATPFASPTPSTGFGQQGANPTTLFSGGGGSAGKPPVSGGGWGQPTGSVFGGNAAGGIAQQGAGVVGASSGWGNNKAVGGSLFGGGFR